ncbi:glutamate formimidoyltransferase [Isachenkonia alkalipeptolytica]|uniref:glutamate formimidoyltransferase n=1 Tax=Isachenkonia alkalipeptolytica TaxID=2565777 RepID=A0AA43XIX5_9CLOT|nr:glutamate formimidoyltransferase [Isachenkonia alkalipeptolytica]NBG87316.1 glutamate formimidoyltransferase [Isachenkonia alkalipeptolytica]
MNKIVQCVPNFSEGRDPKKVDRIVEPFRGKQGVKLLDYSSDEDHNRTVVTLVGEPDPLKEAVIEAMGIATEEIDMTKHEGQHPRMGATDVVPFIPIKNVTMDEAIELSKEVAKAVNEKYDLPIFLYEKSATAPHRQNLAKVRKGQFEAMEEKVQEEDWEPDFGGKKIHPTAGITAVGARMPLVAFNVNLDTDDIDFANQIAKNVRHLSGGFRYCKGIGIELKDRGIVQVSMNMTDFTKTALYRVFELIKIEAKRYGVNVVGSEIIGLLPMEALIDTAVYYLGVEDFSMDQVLEQRIME